MEEKLGIQDPKVAPELPRGASKKKLENLPRDL